MRQVSEEEIRRLRRLVCETAEDSPYTDEMLTEYIEHAEGRVYWAAAEICQEKAAATANMYDFSADGGSYDRSQVSDKWLKMSDRYNALGGKRSGGTIRLKKWPKERQEPNVFAE